MVVSWHPEEVSKLMVAEKSGILHLFNIVSYHPILSLDCGTGPLLSADWSLYNSLLIATSIRYVLLRYPSEIKRFLLRSNQSQY